MFNSEKKLRSRITVFRYMKDLDNNIPIWNMSSCFLAQKFLSRILAEGKNPKFYCIIHNNQELETI